LKEGRYQYISMVIGHVRCKWCYRLWWKKIRASSLMHHSTLNNTPSVHQYRDIAIS